MNEAIFTAETPQAIAEAIEPAFAGTVEQISICEQLDGWTVSAKILPDDQRRRSIEIHAYDDSRAVAIAKMIEAAESWAEAWNCQAKD